MEPPVDATEAVDCASFCDDVALSEEAAAAVGWTSSDGATAAPVKATPTVEAVGWTSSDD